LTTTIAILSKTSEDVDFQVQSNAVLRLKRDFHKQHNATKPTKINVRNATQRLLLSENSNFQRQAKSSTYPEFFFTYLL